MKHWCCRDNFNDENTSLGLGWNNADTLPEVYSYLYIHVHYVTNKARLHKVDQVIVRCHIVLHAQIVINL